MKRVLLDQGLSPRTAVLLREASWDAVHVSEIGMACATDEAIMARAVQETRVCVTLDRDFHAHLAATQTVRPSVVLVRADGLKAEGQKDLLVQVWRRIEDDFESGVAVSASPRAIRVRHLPLGVPKEDDNT